MKKIRHWHQETVDSGRWIETGPLKEATVEILIKHFDQPEILDCTEEEIKYWKLHDEIVTLRSKVKSLEAKIKTAKRDAIIEAHQYAIENGSEHCPEDWLAYIDTFNN